MSQPVFKNGKWHYERPKFKELPQAGSRFVVTAFPHLYEEGQWKARFMIFDAPLGDIRSWFYSTIGFHFGYNVQGWAYGR